MLMLVTTILECLKGGFNAMRKTIINHCLNLCQNIVFTPEQVNQILMLN